MISIVKGQIAETGHRYVVLDTGHIGYRINITDDALHGLKIGGTLSLFTHFAVREDSQELYGFKEKKERDIFELLITVSGIGPKTALNILSIISSEALASAIHSGSTAHLVKVSGIGRKTAEKIILELKDKLANFRSDDIIAGMASDADTLEALKALGYEAGEIRDVLKQIPKDITDTGDKVKAALKLFGK